MKRRFSKKLLSAALSAVLVAGIAFSGSANAAELDLITAARAHRLVQNLSTEQLETLEDMRTSDAQPIGLVGFEGEFALDGGNEYVNVIVEFKTQPAVTTQLIEALHGTYVTTESAQRKIDQEQAAFERATNNDDLTINNVYTQVFNGVAVTLPASEVQELMDLDMVYGVYPDYIVEIENNNIMNTDSVADETIDSIGYPGMYDTDLYYGLSEIHETYTGKGVVVGVCDSGIDYNHPDLKDAFVGGYDFVDNDDDPMETTYIEWLESGEPETNANGNSYYTSHGTHVSGEIAGTGKSGNAYATTGIAPDVELHVYRVLGHYGSGQTTWILAGVEQAVADGCEVINLSLGASVNQPWYISNTAMNNVVLRGVVACVSAGNNGVTVAGSLGSPGGSDLAFTVGAAQIDARTTNMVTVNNGVTTTFPLQGMNFKNRLDTRADGNTVIRDAGITIDEDTYQMACIDVGPTSPSAFDGKDVNGKIVIFSSIGTVTTFLGIRDLVMERGGCGIILTFGSYNAMYLAGLTSAIPYMSIAAAQGTTFINAWRVANPTRDGWITFKGANVITRGGTLASFSSTGPVSITRHVKPDIVAPGVNILATAPYYVNAPDPSTPYSPDFDYATGYQYMSGTSMSCPHMTGMCALLVQKYKDAGKSYNPIDIKATFMNTANDSFFTTTYTVFQKGAGMADLKRALNSTTIVKSDVLALKYGDFNEQATFVSETAAVNFERVYPTLTSGSYTDTKEVRIDNLADAAKTYTMSYKYSGSTSASLQYFNFNGAQTASITVPANDKGAFNFSYNVPYNAAKSGTTYYTYAGWIILTNTEDATDIIRVPFQIAFQNIAVEDNVTNFYYAKPAVSLGSSAYSSNQYSDLNYTPWGRINFVGAYVLDSNGDDIGILAMRNKANTGFVPCEGRISTLASNPVYGENNVIPNAFTGYYYPYDTNVVTPLPEGCYKVTAEFLYVTNFITMAWSAFAIGYDYLFVDNTPAELTITNEHGLTAADPLVYLYNEDTVTITGNVNDLLVDEISDLTELTYNYGNTQEPISRKYNAVKIDGIENPINVNDDGSFEAVVPVPAGSESVPVAVNVYALDLYKDGSALNISEPTAVYVQMYQYVTGVKILNPALTNLQKNKTVQLNVVVSPESAFNKDVTYVSSNPRIATVDENGVVKGVSAGTVVITVTTVDRGINGKTYSAMITVKVTN